MILEQFLNKKAKEINNPISNWGVGFTAEVINEWIELQGLVKPGVSGSLPTDEEIKNFAVDVTEPFARKGENINMAKTWIELGAKFVTNKITGNNY